MSNLPIIRTDYGVDVLKQPVVAISEEEVKQLKEGIKKWGLQAKSDKISKNVEFIVDRDMLLTDFLFHTGIRISDVVGRPYEKHRRNGTIILPWDGIRFRDINWQTQYLQFVIHKRTTEKKIFVHQIILSKEMLYSLQMYKQKWAFKDEDVIFKMTLQNFDQNLKKYCEFASIKYYSAHKFRHGCAVKDLSEQKPDFLTSFRLGHSNTAITNSTYRRMTPEWERQMRGY